MFHNNYVVVKKVFEVETEVFYADTFAQAEALMTREMFIRAAEEGDTGSEWFIASVQNSPTSKWERRAFALLDWFRTRSGS